MPKKTKAKPQTVCEQCPWRLANQSRRSPGGFYTRANLTRMWNRLRNGGNGQSCHMTDPSHPDHLAAGCPEGAAPRECPGSIILIHRELLRASQGGRLGDDQVFAYLRTRRRGLTKSGFLYWALQRIALGHLPIVGGPPLPAVDVGDSAVGLPDYLKEG